MPYKNPKDPVNVARARATAREWSLAHPERRYAHNQKYFRTHGGRELHNAKQVERNARDPRGALIRGVKARAVKAGLAFNLTVEGLHWPSHCPVRGVPMGPRGSMDGPSIDRVDPTGGYTIDNVRVISRLANIWKSNLTIPDVRALLNYMVEASS